MGRTPAFICLLLGAFAATSGCKSRVELIPVATVSITLDSGKKSPEARAGLQNLILITLPPAEPGFTWQIAFHDPRFLKQMSELKPGPIASPAATVSFLTLHIGRTHVRLLLMPPTSDRNAAPVDQQDLLVVIE